MQWDQDKKFDSICQACPQQQQGSHERLLQGPRLLITGHAWRLKRGWTLRVWPSLCDLSPPTVSSNRNSEAESESWCRRGLNNIGKLGVTASGFGCWVISFLHHTRLHTHARAQGRVNVPESSHETSKKKNKLLVADNMHLVTMLKSK